MKTPEHTIPAGRAGRFAARAVVCLCLAGTPAARLAAAPDPHPQPHSPTDALEAIAHGEPPPAEPGTKPNPAQPAPAQPDATKPQEKPAGLPGEKEIALSDTGQQVAEAQARYAAGLEAEALGDVESAIAHFQAAFAADPALTDVGLRLASESIRRKETEKALGYLDTINKRKPRDPDLLASLSFGYSWVGRTKTARSLAAATLARKQDHAFAHAILFDLDLRNPETDAVDLVRDRAGDFAKKSDFWISVAEAYARLLTERDSSTAAQTAGKVLPLFKAAVTRAGDNTDLLLRVAGLYELDRHDDQALALLEKAARLKPKDVISRARMGMLYIRKKKYAEAAKVIEEVLLLEPARIAVAPSLADLYGLAGNKEKYKQFLDRAAEAGSDLMLLAEIALKHADWAGAETLLVRAMERSGSDPNLWSRLAHTQLKQNKNSEAAKTMDEAAEKFSGSADMLMMAAATHRIIKNYDRAAALLDQTARLGESSGDTLLQEAILFEKGVLAERRGDMPAAAELLQALIARNPEHHKAMNYLSFSWADRGERLDESLALVEKALKLDPDNAAYLDTLGWVRYRQGKYNKALEPISKASELEPDEPEILDHLGDVYWKLGRTKDAVKAWTSSLSREPDRPGVKEKIEIAVPKIPAKKPASK